MTSHSLWNRANIMVILAAAMLTVSILAYLNRPEVEPAWPETIQGFSFSPARMHQDPLAGIYPTRPEIEEDIRMLAGKTFAIRTYSMDDAYTPIPEIAKHYDINVALGAWLDWDTETNDEQVERLIQASVQNSNVVRLIVGNESLLRGDISEEQLIAYLDRVNGETDIPVSTAEPWHVWIKHPEVVKHVDYLAVHMLPYWEGISLDDATDYIVQHLRSLEALFPGKPIVITEVGWPSEGRVRESAVASSANQAIFLRRFLARAEQEGYIYYVMEAFDQPWKRQSEGEVGAYWGVFDVHRQQKIPFTESIVAIQHWYILAAISICIAIIILSLFLLDSHTLKKRGRSFLALIAFALATIVVWITYDYTHQYLTVKSIVVGILMLSGMVGVVVILLTEAHEWVEAIWTHERKRAFSPQPIPDDQLPMVSIHVATYNEPPEMVIETIQALTKLDYPRFEVIILDNNTQDRAVWEPVEAFCKTLPSHIRFVHLDHVEGFKAGALNAALTFTSRDAKIVGVIDSDYLVDPRWLRDLVPLFVTSEKTAIVQAPQDYRDAGQSIFKTICYAEYAGFFFIGMITRNERNAIIQHGTMTLMRRSTLEAVGGWSEWCITEDADLGLRIFEAGQEAMYVPQSYGKGLMPDTFVDYKKQRYRWAYGAMQIFKKHLRALFNLRDKRLTTGQRYHFLAGWFPWLSDAINLVFNWAAIAWTIAMLLFPKDLDPPLVEFSILPLVLFSFKLGKLIYLYRTRMQAPILEILGAAVAGLALSYTIAIAVLKGLFTSQEPFFRTPKLAHRNSLVKSLLLVLPEAAMLLALATLGFLLWYLHAGEVMTLDLQLWLIVLGVQCIPYASAILVALLSASQEGSAPIIASRNKAIQTNA